MEQLNLFFSIIGWVYIFLFMVAFFAVPALGFIFVSSTFFMFTYKEIKYDSVSIIGLTVFFLALHIVWVHYLVKRKFL